MTAQETSTPSIGVDIGGTKVAGGVVAPDGTVLATARRATPGSSVSETEDAIAAVAVGGTLLAGGRATVLGTLTGALIIQLLRYTLLANGVPDAAALVVKAGVIVLDVWVQRRGGG